MTNNKGVLGVLINAVCNPDCSMFLSHQRCQLNPEKCIKVTAPYAKIMAMVPDDGIIDNLYLKLVNDIEGLVKVGMESNIRWVVREIFGKQGIRDLIKQRLEGKE